MQKSVKKEGFHSIGATIRTRQESLCLPYAGLLNLPLDYFQTQTFFLKGELYCIN